MTISSRVSSSSDVLTKTAERSSWFATSFLWKESHTALAFLTGAAIQRCSTRLLFDGSPCTNGTVKAVDVKMHGFDQSVCIDIPAFSCMYFTVKKEERPVPEKKAENKKKTKTKTAAKKTAVKKAAKAKTTKKSHS